jgi:hypothetical protein
LLDDAVHFGSVPRRPAYNSRAMPYLLLVPLVLFGALLVALGIRTERWRITQANCRLSRWADENGLRILRQEFSRGPFFWTSRGQVVYFVVVEDSQGNVRPAWIVCGSWWAGQRSDKVTVRWVDGEFFVVFRDRSQRRLEYTYLVSPEHVAAQVAKLDGLRHREDRKWYWLTPAPPALLRQARLWSTRGAVKRLSWSPNSSPPFTCTTFTADCSDDTEFEFSGQQEGVTEWFATLRTALVQEQYHVSELPRWIAAKGILKHHLGMYGGI